MNFFVIVLLWQHILYLCTLFLVQGGKCTCVTIRKSCVLLGTTYKNFTYI